jgi:hypothetical protein
VTAVKWVDYSGAIPILLPLGIKQHWNGFYLPSDPAAGRIPDLELSDANYDIYDDFDFEHPKTDYDRAGALAGISPVQLIPVGTGHGVVFAAEMDRLTWWSGLSMLVNGGVLPDLARLNQIDWSRELELDIVEPGHFLMNACDHGADEDGMDFLEVTLLPGRYVIEYGRYGWHADDPYLVLFRFVRVQ